MSCKCVSHTFGRAVFILVLISVSFAAVPTKGARSTLNGLIARLQPSLNGLIALRQPFLNGLFSLRQPSLNGLIILRHPQLYRRLRLLPTRCARVWQAFSHCITSLPHAIRRASFSPASRATLVHRCTHLF